MMQIALYSQKDLENIKYLILSTELNIDTQNLTYFVYQYRENGTDSKQNEPESKQTQAQRCTRTGSQ